MTMVLNAMKQDLPKPTDLAYCDTVLRLFRALAGTLALLIGTGTKSQ